MCLFCLLLKAKMERKCVVRKKMAVAVTIGAALGVLTGVQLAPKSGRETRKDIVENIKEMKKKVKEVSEKNLKKMEVIEEKIVEKTNKMLDEVKETVSDIEEATIQSPHIESFRKKLK